MKLRDFLKDRYVAYISFAVVFGLMFMFMAAFHVQTDLIAVLSILFWLGVLIPETWEFFRRKKFYDDLTHKLE